MGSYCQLYISDYPVFSSKSYVVPEVMTMFRESDKNVYQRSFGERNQVEWGHVEAGNDDYETAVEYKAVAKNVRQRLDIIGFNIERVKREFYEVKAAEVKELKKMSQKEISQDDELNLWQHNLRQNEIEILESHTFEDYLSSFKTILNSDVHPVHYLERNPDSPPLIKYILNDNDEFYWGFPCKDSRCFLRALLEIVPDNSLVIQDITDLVHAGYYEADDEVCHMAMEALIGDYAISSKIIVLTEGSSDTEILQGSLKLLYPHIYEYYAFMDFGVKPPGGVGPLVNAVKSFAGAGIENRIIALFDNDTAAYSAIQNLRANIPSNIKITNYPNIELAKAYPTLGPNGLSKQNINGLACGIELYLGIDVLINNGELTPIQWKGYNEGLGRYQGEILHKSAIQKKFLQKLSECSTNTSEIENYDWAGLRQIFQHIFEVFSA